MKDEIKLTKLAKCAGCGAKVGAGILAQLLGDIRVHSDPNLLVGFDKSDDASVYKVSDELALVQTVDFFPPIADDPYVFGQIAATNALSDVYAMGGEPKLCLNIMAVPESMPKQTVHEILRGGYDKVYEAGALITGGHSIYDDEPKYGLAVTGFIHPDRILTNSGAKPGDVLFLTKPLGIGILTTAQKAELLSEDGKQLAQRLMTTLNKSARDAMVPFRVHACTDVTGFSFLGHASEMAAGSDVQLRIDTAAIDLIPRRWTLPAWASCPPACTATAPLPSPWSTPAAWSWPCRICSTTRRPRAVCSSPVTRPTRTRCSPRSRMRSPVRSAWARCSPTRAAQEFI